MAYREVQTVTTWKMLRLWADYEPLTTIAASVGCDRKTVRSYIMLARTMGLNREDFIPERKEELLPRLHEAASRRVHRGRCPALVAYAGGRGHTSGPHGLPLMGTGDWNDGMNLVGAGGKGESVWLAMAMARSGDGTRGKDHAHAQSDRACPGWGSSLAIRY